LAAARQLPDAELAEGCPAVAGLAALRQLGVPDMACLVRVGSRAERDALREACAAQAGM
jgi:hypothetical protein